MTKIRPLYIDEEVRARVREVESFAATNLYRPGQSETIPGDDPRHEVTLSTYRCVFSYTQMPTGLFRHLSISVPGKDYPNPFAIYTIAELFGFTGWDGSSELGAPDWLMRVVRKDHCIVLAQEVS